MPVLSISEVVRATIGRREAAALIAGEGLPEAAQCFQCGGEVPLHQGQPDSATLSVVVMGQPGGGQASITLFAHRDHSPSRVLTGDQFEAMANPGPSPVPDMDPVVFVDGERVI